MSEEILNKYIELINKNYCSDCNELNCIDNFPHKKIANAIRELQQENQKLKQWDKNKDTRNSRQRVANYELLKENQQLKEEIEKLNYIINKQDRDITTISKSNKKLKSVLDEIREYIEKESYHYAYEDDYDIYLCENELEDLLQILDKVNSEQHSENV